MLVKPVIYDLQRHVKTEHKANQTPCKKDNRACQVSPQNTVLISVRLLKVRVCPGSSFWVARSLRTAQPDDWAVRFLQGGKGDSTGECAGD